MTDFWREYSTLIGLFVLALVVVFKESGGRVPDRRVVLYFYVKDVRFTTDKINTVPVSALAPPSGEYDMALADAKELMGEAIPLLFEPRKEGKMLITSLAERGIGGYLTILFLFSIPLAIMVYPKLAARKRSHGDHRQE